MSRDLPIYSPENLWELFFYKSNGLSKKLNKFEYNLYNFYKPNGLYKNLFIVKK